VGMKDLQFQYDVYEIKQYNKRKQDSISSAETLNE